jgi:16S rRNA (cytosine967-C5)-methyltransferase
MAKISPSRKAAFQVLMAVERGHSHSDDLLRGRAVNALSAPDRNLATALVLGVLRWQIQLDHRIQALLARPNAKLDPEIRISMRLGAFQLLQLDRIPARAAIDESVELAQQAGHHFASGMVNAVLRKLAKTTNPKRENIALKGHDFSRAASAAKSAGALAPERRFPKIISDDFLPSAEISSLSTHKKSATELALAQAHPAWLVERWINQFGLDSARAICFHGQTQPLLTVRLASPSVETELTAAGIVLEPGELLTAARTVLSGDIPATEAFREGRVRLQDEGSQLVAELVSNSHDQNVKSILDCCAAPGGKTLILTERNPQAQIVAIESSAPRLEQLHNRLAGFAGRIECRHADAAALTEDSAFDLVLADVPCSGTGTLGRNPEIRHRLRPEDLARQAERQRAILTAAIRAVRPGGLVVYSTCSLEPEENEQVVAAVLAATPNSRQASLQSRIDKFLREGIFTPSGAQRMLACLTPEGALRLLPGTFHTDGFFIALIEKNT